MSIAYRILKKLISDGKRSKEDLLTMADVYYAAGRITKEEYENIVNDSSHTMDEKTEEVG